MMLIIEISVHTSLTTGNLPTLPQCGSEGVVLCGLRSHGVKMLMIMNDEVYVWEM